MTETEKRPPGWGEAVEAASVAMAYPYRPDWNEEVLAKQALAAAWPVLAAALAGQIEAAAPSADEGSQAPDARILRVIQRGGYLNAAEIVRAASVRSQGETE